MASFLDLQTRVKRRVIDLPASVVTEVPDLINETIRELEDLHNFHVMRKLVATTTTEGQRKLLTTPTDFKAFRGRPYFTADAGSVTEMTIAPNKQAAMKAFGEGSVTDTGTPTVLLQAEETDAGVADIDVYPRANGLSDYTNGDYRITIPYWRYLTALSADGDTNWFTVNAIPWILNKATAEAFALNWDEARAVFWEQRAGIIDSRGRASGSLRAVLNLDKRYWTSGVTTFVPFRGAREAKIRRL